MLYNIIMSCFLIYPTALIEDIRYYKNKKCILIDDPLFYSDKERIINYNKLKLIYHKATMLYYREYLKSKKINVDYIEYHKIGKIILYKFI